jgi:hypothetical protein
MRRNGCWLAVDVGIVRQLVPRAVRHGISAQLARVREMRLERDLAALASGSDTIVAGPWLGEVGFELLYWVPFLAWFAERFAIAPERLLVVSRGGTRSWYEPFAAGYREIFDYLSPDDFRRRHEERIAANGEQKQTRVLAFEHELLRDLTRDVHDRRMLHPSTMYGLFNPFWWGHVGESWVHRHTRFRRLHAPAAVDTAVPSEPYVAVKFYFNECFPATEANRTFVRDTLERLSAAGPVVSLTTNLNLDDHGGADVRALGVRSLPTHLQARENLEVQSAIVARASAFVGTYGGFSYLAPFYGVRSTAFYSDAHGFSKRHLAMARSACRSIGVDHLLDVQPIATAASSCERGTDGLRLPDTLNEHS